MKTFRINFCSTSMYPVDDLVASGAVNNVAGLTLVASYSVPRTRSSWNVRAVRKSLEPVCKRQRPTIG